MDEPWGNSPRKRMLQVLHMVDGSKDSKPPTTFYQRLV
jgi:hypothetical protein